jgi:hypothetical protein
LGQKDGGMEGGSEIVKMSYIPDTFAIKEAIVNRIEWADRIGLVIYGTDTLVEAARVTLTKKGYVFYRKRRTIAGGYKNNWQAYLRILCVMRVMISEGELEEEWFDGPLGPLAKYSL